MKDRTMRLAAMAVCLATLAAPGLRAETIISEWANVRPPPPPELKSVTVDPKTTAFLVLDIVKQTCNEQRRPRCLNSVAPVHAFLDRARKADMPVAYSIVVGSTLSDILPEVAPAGGEPIVTAMIDKFYGTDLDAVLKGKGIKTVIIVGTAAQGAIITTVAEAVIRGYAVVLPLDGVTGDLYSEQYLAWHEMNAPGVSGHVTLTATDMIHF